MNGENSIPDQLHAIFTFVPVGKGIRERVLELLLLSKRVDRLEAFLGGADTITVLIDNMAEQTVSLSPSVTCLRAILAGLGAFFLENRDKVDFVPTEGFPLSIYKLGYCDVPGSPLYSLKGFLDFHGDRSGPERLVVEMINTGTCQNLLCYQAK